MSVVLSPSAQKVQDTLAALGFPHQVVELPQSTRSAAEAGQAIGCHVAQIAKSLIFRGQTTGKPILVIASGVNRVNEQRLAERVSEPIARADVEFVRERTGFVIGGVPPVGHAAPLETLIDEDLLRNGEIWAAAGTPHAVFRLPPADLIPMTGGRVLYIL